MFEQPSAQGLVHYQYNFTRLNVVRMIDSNDSKTRVSSIVFRRFSYSWEIHLEKPLPTFPQWLSIHHQTRLIVFANLLL